MVIACAAALVFLAGSAQVQPPVTNGLKLSLDASALTGLTNGATVTTWMDMSGNNNHAAATTTGRAATYQANALNGKPVVRFHSNGNASFNFNRVANIRTVFWVLKNTKPGFRFLLGDSDYADFDPGDAPSFPLWRASTPDVIRKGTTKLMGNVVDGTTTALPSTSYSVLSLVTTGDVRANQLSLDRSIAGRSWAGDMAEVLIYDRALTTGEEVQVGSYLASKYGLTTAYPPFKLGVSLAAPTNGEVILSGTSVIATTDVIDPGAFTPHTVRFHVTPASPPGPTVVTKSTSTRSPYTADWGTLAAGIYEIYETIVNSATPAGMATSATRTFTVAPAVPTTTTLASPATPSTYGQNVSFTATVSPTPTGGTVQFYDGVNTVGSPVAVNATTGVASISTNTLGAGTHVITAQYRGYTIYTPSTTAGSISQVVEKAPLTVTAQNLVRALNTANPASFPYQSTGLTNGQTLATSGVTGTPSLTTTAIPSSPVGAYPIACALGSLSASNYSFTLVNGTLVVQASSFPVTRGLVFHLDASALTGLSNGDTVITWADMSGNNNHAAATGSAATYQTHALNGKPVVRFNPNGNASFNFNRVSNIRTVFWVFKKPNINTFTFFLGDSAFADFDPGAPTIWRASTPDVIRNGTTKLMGNVVDGTTTSLTSNYSLLSLRTTGDVRANQLSLDRNIAGRSWTGDMAEVLIYDRALTTGEEEFVGSYLASKYGLTTAYPPFEMAVSLTAPANAEGFISGTSVKATVSVTDPGAFIPHTVRFHVTPTSPPGPPVVTKSTSTRSPDTGALGRLAVGTQSVQRSAFQLPYTADLGRLAVGTYQIYAAVVNSATTIPGTVTSATRTFSVESSATWAHSGSMFILTTPAGANLPAGASVSNFPLLVRFNSGNFNFAQAAADGRDIRFSTAAGTAIPYEIEQWDPAGGKAAVWVKIPTITGNSTQEIIMYWGKSGTNPQAMSLGAAGGDADVNEARISSVVRSADWVTMVKENQKPMQTLVGPLVQPGNEFSLSQERTLVKEGQSAAFIAKAGGAQKLYWILKRDGREEVVATDCFRFAFDAGRVTSDGKASLQFKAVYADGVKSKDIAITIKETIPEPVFTLKVPTKWDGRSTLEVESKIANLAAMQAANVADLKYEWSAGPFAVIKEVAPGKLRLLRSQNSGKLTVTAKVSNGGKTVTQSVDIMVTEPKQDAWVQRVPEKHEKPVDGQFYARDDKNEGTLYYNGTLSNAAEKVFVKLYADNKLIKTETAKPAADKSYAFTLKLKPGLIQYKVEFGTKISGQEKVLETVNDLVCGDSFIIDGQSNALATDTHEQSPPETNKWIRSYGGPTGYGDGTQWVENEFKKKGVNPWCYPVWKIGKGEKAELGWWGMCLAKRLHESQKVPIFILQAAVGGSRIDLHQRCETNHTALSTMYGRMLWRVQQAKLTHGIRAIIWHQGENDQGKDGPTGGYGWETYQSYFIEMSAAWKQDFPNVKHYTVFQIFPNSCAMGGGNGDMLRERQRTLPLLYSNMSILSTLGVTPPGGAHYPLEGWAVFAQMLQPIIEKEIYGKVPAGPVTAPNVKSVKYAGSAQDKISVEFDQPVVWSETLAGEFYLDGEKGKVASGAVSGNVLTLSLQGASSAKKISYIKEMSWSQDNLLIGANGLAALTFCNVPIE